MKDLSPLPIMFLTCHYWLGNTQWSHIHLSSDALMIFCSHSCKSQPRAGWSATSSDIAVSAPVPLPSVNFSNAASAFTILCMSVQPSDKASNVPVPSTSQEPSDKASGATAPSPSAQPSETASLTSTLFCACFISKIKKTVIKQCRFCVSVWTWLVSDDNCLWCKGHQLKYCLGHR